MNYCSNCGRENHDHCICLSGNPISKNKVLLVYILTIVVPMTILILKRNSSVFDIAYPFYGGIALSIVLLILTILNFVTKQSYLALFFGCHQSVNRTIHIKKHSLPICARCLGIYLGVFPSVILFYLFTRPYYTVILFSLPLIIDGYIQKKGILYSDNKRRLITGLLFSPTLVYIYSLFYSLIIYALDSIDKYI